MYSETSKLKTKESQKCHGRVRNLKILSKVLQTRLDKCVKKKANRKVQKTLYVFRNYTLGYGTFQEIFLENVATFFIFCKTSFGPRTSGGAPGASGASPTGADRF
jgi:hypothetical protein